MQYKLLIILAIVSLNSYSQLGFCSGNTGDPIFTENFGAGTNFGPPLPAGTTTYNFINANNPQDGEYTLASSTFQFGWNMPSDHTPNDINGKALIVNADFDPGEFYRTTISGLCENNSYEFSAWLLNILPASACSANGLPVNVKFQIWDSTDSNLLAEGDTGNINGTNSPNWQAYGLTFSTLENQTEVILKMINNSIGGCGNDLAIDDIAFKSCGDLTEVTFNNSDTYQYCENTTFSPITITAEPDFSTYTSHFYQWQISQDLITWTNITNETNNTLTITNSSGLDYYRALVAEDQINVENNLCNSSSNIFTVTEGVLINPVSLGDVLVCPEDNIPLAVQENSAIQVNWYDAPINGNLLEEDSFTFQPPSSGSYYAEAVTVSNNCINPNRVEIIYTVENYIDPVSLGDVDSCEGNQIPLEVQFNPNIVVNWYDAPNGGNLLESNSFTYTPNDSGTYYAEAITINNQCANPERLPINYIITSLETPVSLGDVVTCENETAVLEIENNSAFTINWYDAPIGGNLLASNSFNFTPSTTGTYFAEAVPLNGSCVNETRIPINFTEIEFISAVSLGNVAVCEGENGTLAVEANPAISINWYDAPTGGNLVQENSYEFSPSTEGAYYAEAISLENNCINPNREEIIFSINPNPNTPQPELINICENDSATLSAISGDFTYLWNTGETTQSISVQTAGYYSVEIINSFNCSSTQNFSLNLNQVPIISSVESQGNGIQITMQNDGDFSYAINDSPFQDSPYFPSVQGGLKTITVIENNNCGQDQTNFLHLVIPKFFTPNSDGINDTFKVNDAYLVVPYHIQIFNRYGQLLVQSKNQDFSWDGIYNGAPLPSNDYWYQITIGDQKFTGNITLKR